MVAVPTRDRNASQHRAEHPDKLAELRDLFWQEARKYQVMSLVAGFYRD